jgi:hypothetical protein
MLAAQPGRSRHDPERADDQRSADQVHVLLAGRGRGGADPRVGEEDARTGRGRGEDPQRRGENPPAQLLRGVLRPASASRKAASPPCSPARPPSRRPGSGRRISTSPSCRTPKAARKSCTWPKTASARMAIRKNGWPNGWTEIGGKLPVNTDGGCLACGEPIGASGLRQVYENVVQLRGGRASGRCPAQPRFGYSAMSMARRAFRPSRFWSANGKHAMQGKVALVTGGAEGIGAAVARLIVAEGGSVMLGDVQLEKAQGDAPSWASGPLQPPRRARPRATVGSRRRGHAEALRQAHRAVQHRRHFRTRQRRPTGRSMWERTIDINLTARSTGCAPRSRRWRRAASPAPSSTSAR